MSTIDFRERYICPDGSHSCKEDQDDKDVVVYRFGDTAGVLCSSGLRTAKEDKEDIDAMSAELDDTKAMVVSLQDQLDQAEGDLTGTAGQLVSTKSELAVASNDLTDAGNQILSLQSTLDAVDAQVSQLKDSQAAINALWGSLLPYVEAADEVISIFILPEAIRFTELQAETQDFGGYIDDLGNAELSELWAEALAYQKQFDLALFDKKFVEIIARILELQAEKVTALSLEVSPDH